jgi:repressor LexA
MKAMKLTAKETKLLYTIEKYIDDNTISPTVRELATLLKLKSTASVARYITKLEEKGYITKISSSPRSIKVTVRI